MGRGTVNAINRFTGVLFISAFILGITVGRVHPLITHIISVGLILIGTPIFVYGLVTMGKYKDTFDYEPTTFWGRPSNGKTAREVLATFNVAGFWCALTGVTLLLFV